MGKEGRNVGFTLGDVEATEDCGICDVVPRRQGFGERDEDRWREGGGCKF